MATKYSKGRRYEYKARDLLRSQGYEVLRMAGSHGPHDLVAFRLEGGEPVRCIQVKFTESERGRKRMLALFSGFEDASRVEELWVYQGRTWHVKAGK